MSKLPRGWVQTDLGTIAEIQLGKMLDRSRNFGTLTPYLRNVNVRWGHFDLSDVLEIPLSDEEKQLYSVEDGDLFVCEGGEPGRCSVWRGGKTELRYQKALHRLRFYDEIIPEFASNYILHLAQRGELEQFFTGSTIKHLPRNMLAKIPILIPPVPEQQRIVRKIEALGTRNSDAQAALKAIPTLIERFKLNFLRSAFRGEQTAAFRNQSALEPVATLLQKTAAPEQSSGGRKPTNQIIRGKGGISVNNPGTDLPDGWEWVPLLRVARQETGHTPSRSHPEWWGGNIHWVSIPDAKFHHGRVIHNTIQTTNKEGLANSSARLLPEGTVVFSRTASIGYVAIMGREMATSQDFATWTCSDVLEPRYLMYALLSEGNDIRAFGEGTTHTTIYLPEIRAFNIKLAPIEEQREIIRRIDAAFRKIERLTADTETALKLTNRLERRILEKAFIGELVPQNPDDEPATELLNRIRGRNAIPQKNTTSRRKKAAAMKKNPRELLLADSADWPESGLTFEDVAKRVILPHDDLRNALFDLLAGPVPTLEQIFDKSEERMRLKRVVQ